MRRKMILSAVFICLLIFTFSVQSDIYRIKKQYNLIEENFVFAPAEVSSGLLLSGFRGLAVDLLWLKTDLYFDSGQWYKMLPLLRMITYLQPDFIPAWELAGWHAMYNLPAYAKESGDSDFSRYIDMGIDILNEGIRRNPARYELYFTLGWYYYEKAEDYEKAAHYFNQALKYEHPQFMDRLIGIAYYRAGDMDKAVKAFKRAIDLYPESGKNRDVCARYLDKIK